MNTATAESPRTEPQPSAAQPAKRRGVVKLKRGGKLFYLGRMPADEARRALEAARAEYAATGTVTGTRTVRAVQRRPRAADAPEPDPELPALNDGERDLMRAVLREAVRDLSDDSPVIRHAAVRWLRDDHRDYLLSFASICDELDLDAHGIRRSLLARGRP